VEKYLASNKIRIEPPLFSMDALKVRIMYMLNMSRIVEHLWKFITCEETEVLIPLFDQNRKVRSTGDMPSWWTSKPNAPAKKSHISHCVFDSAWEDAEAYRIENNPHVKAWAKNDHLGFGILYTWAGITHTYYPDFLVKLDAGETLILETKGRDGPQVQEKRRALAEWVEAVNALGEYGQWRCAISFNVADVDGIIAGYAGGKFTEQK
jgi:type III restriction enzyme